MLLCIKMSHSYFVHLLLREIEGTNDPETVINSVFIRSSSGFRDEIIIKRRTWHKDLKFPHKFTFKAILRSCKKHLLAPSCSSVCPAISARLPVDDLPWNLILGTSMKNQNLFKIRQKYQTLYKKTWGTRWCSWLRHCATSRKVAGSIRGGVIEIFHWHKPSGRTMDLGFDTDSNRNEYQEYFLWGEGGQCVWLTALPLSCADCLEIWEPQPPGTLRACPGL